MKKIKDVRWQVQGNGCQVGMNFMGRQTFWMETQKRHVDRR